MIEEEEKPMFEEQEIDGEVYSLVPKHLVEYAPTSSVDFEYIDVIGSLEIADNFTYIPTSILPKFISIINNRFYLQYEVAKCHSFISSKFGSDSMPPFDPESIK